MNWKLFNTFGCEVYAQHSNFLVTDGKEIWIVCLDYSYGLWFMSGKEKQDEIQIKSRLTHFCDVKDIPLPNQPERSKREDHESGCGALNIAEMQ
jgi:hypothetical protein